MKKFLSMIVFTLLTVTVFSGCQSSKNVKIIHATDMHYLSQQLTDNSEFFVDMLKTADGKMTHYIDPIFDVFVDDVISQKPDYLILSGDITFNGELLSHIDISQKLEKVQKSGVDVLVIPGNHDIDYPFSFQYIQNKTSITDRLTKEDFEKIYADFGLSKAISRDEQTFSYFYKLSNNLQVLMLDVNTGAQFGLVSDQTLDWIKQNLESAKDKNINTIAVSHQNVLIHSKSLVTGYTIHNNQDLIDIFEQYNVKLNLSGHIHTQHIADYDEKIYDIATGSLAVYPHQYGVIDIDNKTFGISYKTQKTQIVDWANKNNIQDANLLNYDEYGYNFFYDLSFDKLYENLLKISVTDDERAEMAKLFADINAYYFPGNLYLINEDLLAGEGYKLWLKHQPDSHRTEYIKATLNEKRLNHTELVID